MHRSTASLVVLIVVTAAACGGRIAQGTDGDSDETAPSNVGADASATVLMFDGEPPLSTACGATTCAGNDECPQGFGCFIASMGVAGQNRNVEICGGVR